MLKHPLHIRAAILKSIVFIFRDWGDRGIGFSFETRVMEADHTDSEFSFELDFFKLLCFIGC